MGAGLLGERGQGGLLVVVAELIGPEHDQGIEFVL